MAACRFFSSFAASTFQTSCNVWKNPWLLSVVWSADTASQSVEDWGVLREVQAAWHPQTATQLQVSHAKCVAQTASKDSSSISWSRNGSPRWSGAVNISYWWLLQWRRGGRRCYQSIWSSSWFQSCCCGTTTLLQQPSSQRLSWLWTHNA